MNELRSLVRAKLAEDTGVRVADDVCAPRASTVRMDASTIPSFKGKPESFTVWKKAFNNWMKNVNMP